MVGHSQGLGRLSLVSLLALVGLSACFDPRTQEGLACSGTGGCPAGQDCVAGTCYRPGNAPTPDAGPDANQFRCVTESLASGQDSATDLDVTDLTYVYWTANTSTLVLRSPKIRGPVEVFHDSGTGKHPYAVALDSTHVYWSENDAAGRIMRKALTSAPIDPAEELATAQGEPVQLAVDATHVYWANLAAGTINRVPKAGGAIETIASSQLAPNALRVDDDSVYWLNTSAGQIMRSAKAGPPLQQLASGQNLVVDLAVVDGSVAWTDRGDGAIRSVSKEGGNVQNLATGQASPSAIAMSATQLLWTNQATSEVLTAKRQGGSPLEVASGQPGGTSLALDGNKIYWLNNLDQANRLQRASCDAL